MKITFLGDLTPETILLLLSLQSDITSFTILYGDKRTPQLKVITPKREHCLASFNLSHPPQSYSSERAQKSLHKIVYWEAIMGWVKRNTAVVTQTLGLRSRNKCQNNLQTNLLFWVYTFYSISWQLALKVPTSQAATGDVLGDI